MDNIFSGIQLDVLSPDAVKGVEEYIETLCDGDEITEAFWFQRNLALYLQKKAPRLSQEHPEIAAAYDRFLTQCQWVALPRIPENAMIDLFEKHFVSAFQWKTLTLEEKITQMLIVVGDYEERDRKKKAIREALLRNNEMLNEGGMTVQQWIRDYLREVGAKGGTKIAFAEYMTSSANAKKLSEEGRTHVKRLLELFDRLGKSSMTLEGIEEPIPVDDPEHPGVIRGGVYEPVNPEVMKNIDMLRAIRNTVLGVAVPTVQPVTQPPVKLPVGITADLQMSDPKEFIRVLNEAVVGKDITRVGELLLAARGSAELKSLERVQEVKKLVYYDLKTKKFQWK